MSGEDRLSELLDKIVNQAFNDGFGRDLPDDILSGSLPKYTSIKEYTERTGRRFRMTKKQTDRGLNREESFDEFQQNLFKRKK
tara:strand:- start:282 stop:530 length:249 start_codon:yes stop_codon:yes gene_type:complete